MSVTSIYSPPSEQLVLEMLRDALGGGKHGFKYQHGNDTQDFTLQVITQKDGGMVLRVEASRDAVGAAIDAAPFESANLYQHIIMEVNGLLAKAGVPTVRSFDDKILSHPSGAVHAEVTLTAKNAEKFEDEVRKSLRAISLQTTPKGRFSAAEVARAQARDAASLEGGVAI